MVNLNSFPFTEDSDVVEVIDEQIFNDTLVETLNGDDLIENSLQSQFPFEFFAIVNDTTGIINMGQGNDSLIGANQLLTNDSTERTASIVNNGRIEMGQGDDLVSGGVVGFSNDIGIINNGTIKTGQGDDSVSGGGSNSGIINKGTITTGQGDDSVSGGGLNLGGIINEGTITTGKGNDSVIGDGINSGIINKGTIATGQGDDSMSSESEGSAIINEGNITTGQGNDSILANSLFGNVIFNEGTITTGKGNDSILANTKFGSGIRNDGTIQTNQGNDLIKGSSEAAQGGVGIENNGIISTGQGNDSILGEITSEEINSGINSGRLLGLENNQTIKMGTGNDSLAGKSGTLGQYGIGLKNNQTIEMGAGNDSLMGQSGTLGSGIENNGTIEMGADSDSLIGLSGTMGSGIENTGTIEMGAGNDSLMGQGSIGIINNGTIEMGAGSDLIKSERFDGVGSIKLGRGDDVIEGFGKQTVDGGAGFDRAKFDFDVVERVEVLVISDDSLVIERGRSKMTFTDVELFEFADFTFSFDELSSLTFSTINFDEGNLAAGTIVTDQFEGLSISTPSEFEVMIFDTDNPTGGDDDLFAFVGNALIISEDGDSSDPDDNAAGGTISIEFDQLATVTSIGLLDIEETGGSINLFADDSSLIEVIEIPASFDGDLQRIDIDVQNVASLDINLVGSGALTELNYFELIDNDGISDTNI